MRTLFAANFDKLSVLPPNPADNWGTGCWQDVSGQNIDVLGGGARILNITDPCTSNPLDSIMSSSVSLGVLGQTIKYSQNGTNPQATAPIQSCLTFMPKREAPLHFRLVMKLQADLVKTMTKMPDGVGRNGGTWRSLFAWKSGTYSPASGLPLDDGDFRFELGIGTMDQDVPYWTFYADSNANSGTTWETAKTLFYMTCKSVAVLAGYWFDLTIEWDRERYVEARVNGQTIGRYDGRLYWPGGTLPINRIFAPLIYHGGYFPASQQCSRLVVSEL